MVVVDANVLLYAANASSIQHGVALGWLERALAGRQTVGLAWVVLLAFIRLSTSPVVFPDPLSPAGAMDQVEAWLAAPAAVVLEPSGRHAHILGGLLAGAGTAGNLTTDAHLAALAIEHDAELVSFDRDFARFPGLHHRVPGESSS